MDRHEEAGQILHSQFTHVHESPQAMRYSRGVRKAATRALMLAGGCVPVRRDGVYRGRVLWGTGRGLMLSLNLLDHPALLMGRYERHVVAAMLRHISRDAVVYDVGANIGYLTALAARRASAGTVIAFEPDAANARLLQSNVDRNRLRNVTIEQRAVTCDGRPVQFATYGYSLVNHIISGGQPAAWDATVVERDSVSLDSFVYDDGRPAPSFIKVDVEGAELEALRGAQRVLREARPVVVAEVRPEPWPEVRELMAHAGYRWHWLGGGNPEAGRITDVLFEPP